VWIFLSLQILVSSIQFKQFGPGDSVSGTIGKNGSGILTLLIFFMVYFLTESKMNNLTSSEKLKKNIPYLLLMIPVVLNETKITFILIIIFFISMINLKRITSAISTIIIGISVIVIFSFFYASQENIIEGDNAITGIFNNDFLESYLFGDNPEIEYVDIPRFGKLLIGTQILVSNEKILLGQEYGAFKGGKQVAESQFSKKYDWLLSGTKPYLFFLLITGGIALLLLIISLFIKEIRRPSMTGSNSYSNSLLFFIVSVLILMLFYNDGLRSHTLVLVLIYLLFFSKHFQGKENKINKNTSITQ
jgi:L-asparagine transporter-like permease